MSAGNVCFESSWKTTKVRDRTLWFLTKLSVFWQVFVYTNAPKPKVHGLPGRQLSIIASKWERRSALASDKSPRKVLDILRKSPAVKSRFKRKLNDAKFSAENKTQCWSFPVPFVQVFQSQSFFLKDLKFAHLCLLFCSYQVTYHQEASETTTSMRRFMKKKKFLLPILTDNGQMDELVLRAFDWRLCNYIDEKVRASHSWRISQKLWLFSAIAKPNPEVNFNRSLVLLHRKRFGNTNLAEQPSKSLETGVCRWWKMMVPAIRRKMGWAKRSDCSTRRQCKVVIFCIQSWLIQWLFFSTVMMMILWSFTQSTL